MNRARAALCGLALAVCAAGAAADDEYEASLVRCAGKTIEALETLAAEFPDRYDERARLKQEAFILNMRAVMVDPKGTLLSSSKSPTGVVLEICSGTVVSEMALDEARQRRDGGAE